MNIYNNNSGITFSDINLSFDGKYILKGLSGSIDKGKIISIVGASGSGKTTLLHVLSGLIIPDSGSIFIDNLKIDSVAKNIGIVFQDYSLFPWLTISKNISFGQKMQDMTLEERNQKIKHILKEIGLWEERDKYPHQLSGGMQQRVAIGRTMANDSEYIFMDEPFGALDYLTKIKMHNFVLKICKNLKKTVIIVTHNIDEAISISNTIFLLPLKKDNGLKRIDIGLTNSVDITSIQYQKYKKEILNYFEEDVI